MVALWTRGGGLGQQAVGSRPPHVRLTASHVRNLTRPISRRLGVSFAPCCAGTIAQDVLLPAMPATHRPLRETALSTILNLMRPYKPLRQGALCS